MLGLSQQGAWTWWESFLRRKISWSEIWHSDASRIKFLVQSVYDVLPSSANLHIWGMSESPSCPLCSRKSTLKHILSACPKALGEGRYRWRHDQVLKKLAEIVATAISDCSCKPKTKAICFIKAGEKSSTVRKSSTCMLASARDWQLRVDLGNQLNIPVQITTSSLRPDLLVWSTVSRQVIMLELTVPWEENLEEAFERKLEKYQELVERCRANKWRTTCLPVEIGCRGFAGRSVCSALSRLGVRGIKKRKATRALSEAAEKALRWLWIKRSVPWSSTTGIGGRWGAVGRKRDT